MGRKKALFPELDQIISVLRSDHRQDLVILIIPSHDQHEEELQNQDIWANSALDLFAEIYGGATAFKTFAGVYRCEDGKILRDVPILIEAYVSRADLEDAPKLTSLLKFIKQMGRETRQAAVGLIINNVFHEIKDFGAHG